MSGGDSGAIERPDSPFLNNNSLLDLLLRDEIDLEDAQSNLLFPIVVPKGFVLLE